jgi:hypothetical protein
VVVQQTPFSYPFKYSVFQSTFAADKIAINVHCTHVSAKPGIPVNKQVSTGKANFLLAGVKASAFYVYYDS